LSALTHNILLGEESNLKSSISYSYNANGDKEKYLKDNLEFSDTYKDNYRTKKWNIASTFNHKFNNKANLRTGAIVNFIRFNYYQQSSENPGEALKEDVSTAVSTQTVQAFAQGQYKASDNLTFNLGAHYLQLLYNSTSSIEPRASVKWDLSKKTSLAFGYGLHSQVQAWGVYFAQTTDANNTRQQPNRNLDFTRAHHFVLSHNYLLSKNLRIKTELYYQKLFNVPVSANNTATNSTLNIISEYLTEPLVNKGKGRNYGIELSLEKYLSNNFYWLWSNSFYQSKYTALDGVERNTRFNGGHINTLLAGKDFVSERKSKTFGINIKTIYAGGLRTTPIDAVQSKIKGYTVYNQQQAFSLQNPSYFRTDLRISMKWNRRQRTNTLSLDIQNLTNRQNVYNQWFDGVQNKVVYNYQNGLIPILNYKVEF
jgi:outer membrane receptor protein involved in Fe transport